MSTPAPLVSTVGVWAARGRGASATSNAVAAAIHERFTGVPLRKSVFPNVTRGGGDALGGGRLSCLARIHGALRWDGEGHGDGRAAAGARVDGDAASEHVAHHALYHHQPHPAPLPELLRGEPRLEDALQVFGTDSGTLVAHGEPQRPTGLLQADADGGLPADARVRGVTDQVHEHVVQGVRVALEINLLEREVELERDFLVLEDAALERAAGADHAYGVEPLRARQRAPGAVLDGTQEVDPAVDIDRGVNFLRAIKDRARGTLARSERFDAVRVVRSCCTLESRVLKDKKVPLQFDFTLEEVYLKGDPNALYDMLVNLIRNAADASIGRQAPIRVGLEQAGGALRLTVRDEGAGIRAEDLERIFEPGFTTKEFGEGSGMGLVVVQSVVRNMFGGSIAVDSRPGGGTTVTVTLPVPPQRSVDARQAGEPSAA